MNRIHDGMLAEQRTLHLQQLELDAERLPINWLPVEILIQIFIDFVQADLGEGFVTASNESVAPQCYRSPVIISHVCEKWRDIALATSKLWSRIRYYTTNPNLVALQVFLERSRNVPLDITLTPSNFKTKLTSREESESINSMFNVLRLDRSRCQSITAGLFYKDNVDGLASCINVGAFSSLESLNVFVVSRFTRDIHVFPPTHSRSLPSSGITLRRLRFEHVSFNSIDFSRLANLTHLELCYPTHNTGGITLCVSRLCRLLAAVPLLEDFAMIDTVPRLDYPIIDDDSATRQSEVAGSNNYIVQLPHLKRIEWRYPYPTDVSRLLSLLYVPVLEKLEFCLYDIPVKRSSSNRYENHLNNNVPNRANVWSKVVSFDSLKELIVHCGDEDAIGLFLRRMQFPVLEKMELANMSVKKRQLHNLPVQPRWESIFRDPRLPHLTHLSLSYFNLDLENVKAMLGYIPALTSLSLDSCTGVPKLLHFLTGGTTIVADGAVPASIPAEQREREKGKGDSSSITRRGRGMRYCPRLEALSFWYCSDLAFKELLDVVKTRNTEELVQTNHCSRKIKPLRRPRRSEGASNRVGISLEDVVPTVSRISFVRVKACTSMVEDNVLSLAEYGVDDVLYDYD
jgi:F-box-like